MIVDLKSSQTAVLEQTDLLLLVNVVVYQVIIDQNSMMITRSKEEGWEVSL